MILPTQEKKRTHFRKAMETRQQDAGGSQSQGIAEYQCCAMAL